MINIYLCLIEFNKVTAPVFYIGTSCKMNVHLFYSAIASYSVDRRCCCLLPLLALHVRLSLRRSRVFSLVSSTLAGLGLFERSSSTAGGGRSTARRRRVCVVHGERWQKSIGGS